MHCPRCEKTTLDEREREGVVVDVCQACRGIWLDRGELEKLIARTTADIDDYDKRPGAPSREPLRSREESPRDPAPDRDGYPRDPSRDRAGYDEHRRKYPRKKSLFESLGDIFD